VKSFEAKAWEFKNINKLARTHLQDAIPTTLGAEFSAYAENLKGAARQAGFYSIDLQQETLVKYYDSVKQLTQELKAIGAHNMNAGRASSLTGKNQLQQMVQAYEQFRHCEQLPAHYEVVYLILRK